MTEQRSEEQVQGFRDGWEKGFDRGHKVAEAKWAQERAKLFLVIRELFKELSEKTK